MIDSLPIQLVLAFSLATMALPAAAAVPVHITGNTTADDVLIKDIVQTITYYGDAFHCASPSDIRVSMLNSSMIPAALRKPSLNTSYEEWDAIFCGKTHAFFVTHWPDPAGGSFLAVTYPYPVGAPTATFR